MAMHPVGERAPDLTVDEEPPRHVFGVLGDPGHGEGTDLGRQDHPRARLEGLWRLQDTYLLPWRDQRLDRPRAFMEREDGRRRGGNPRFLDEMVHPVPGRSPP